MTVPTINLEVMLAGWTESHSGGAKLTFWLPDGADLEPFKSLTARKGGTAGQRFMAVMALLGDDEQPQPIEQAQKGKPPLGPRAKLAVQLCGNPDFLRWIRPRYDAFMGGDGTGWGDVTLEDFTDRSLGAPGVQYCRHAILAMCECVESRRELDSVPHCGQLFESQIRKPWAEANC